MTNVTSLPSKATPGAFVFAPAHHGFYDDLVTMLVSLSSYMFAMHVSIASNNSKPFDQRPLEEWISYIAPIKSLEFPLSLERNATNENIIFFPGYILLHISLDSWPHSLEYKIELKPNSKPDHRLTAEGNRNVIARIVGASFTNYYSNNESKFKSKYGTAPDKWPETIRFAWAIRNGFAHGNSLSISDPNIRPLVWKLWSFDRSHDSQPFLFATGMLGIGDIIALMEEFDTYVFSS